MYRGARPLEEEALHVERGAGEHDELARGALRDRAVRVAEQDGRRPESGEYIMSPLVLQKVPSEDDLKVRNHGEGPY